MCIHFFQVGLDSRPVMREAYALFKDGGDPAKVLLADVPMCICNLCSHNMFLSISCCLLFLFYFSGFS